ncbi:MAG: hypothetical protein RSA92_03600 [Bacteroidaceae bacterium]
MIIGRGINNGLVPYRDLFDHKGPVLFFIYALADIISTGKAGLFLLQLLNLTIVLELIYRISLFFTTSRRSYLVIFLFLFFFLSTIDEGAMNEEWSLPYLFLSLWLAIKTLNGGTEKKLPPLLYSFIYGVCFGFVFLIRANNVGIICGILFVFLIVLIRQKAFCHLLFSVLSFLLGWVLISLPFLWYFYSHSAIDEFIYGAFAYNYMYAVDGFSNTTLMWNKIMWLFTPCFLLVILRIKAPKAYSDYGFLLFSVTLFSVLALLLGFSYKHYYTLLLPLITVFFAGIIGKEFINKRNFIIILFVSFVPFAKEAVMDVGKNVLYAVFRTKDAYYLEAEKAISVIPKEDRNSTLPYMLGYLDYRLYLSNQMLPCYRFFFFQNRFGQDDITLGKEIDDLFLLTPPLYVLTAEINEIESKTVKKQLNEVYDLIYKVVNQNELTLEIYRLKSHQSCH